MLTYFGSLRRVAAKLLSVFDLTHNGGTVRISRSEVIHRDETRNPKP